MFISLRSKARGLQRLPFLKYYNVQKEEHKFILELDSANDTHYIKKYFK